jgi:N-acylglucosamine 2-epimerase
MRVYGHRPEQRFADLAARLADFAYAYGWDDEFGGWYDAVDRAGGVTRDSKGFWPQCEGVMAALWLWGHTGQERHREVFERSARYCFERCADAEFGGWFTSLERDGTVRNAAKGSAWKADYHVVQMCAETYRFLSARKG